MCSSGFLNRYVNYFPDYRQKAMGADIYKANTHMVLTINSAYFNHYSSVLQLV